MARQGIYWRLRDGGTPWCDRVKLARYAWSHDHVHVPNKHQALLDWLTLALTGKKRVSPDVSAAPWQCLSDMLRSSRCQRGSTRGRQLVLKAIVGQVLLSELRAHAGNGRPTNCSTTDTVVSCVHAILTSPSLRHVFTHRLDMTIQLLAVSVELCIQDVRSDDGGFLGPGDELVSAEKLSLLDTVLDILGDTQWRRVSTQQVLQVTCQHLVLTVARFHAAVRERDLPTLGQRAPKLVNFTCQALFQRDLWEHYQLYLGVKAKSGSAEVKVTQGSAEVKVTLGSEEVKAASGSALPKDVEGVFNVLGSLLTAQESRCVMQELLPVLYSGFLDSYKTRTTQTGMHLLRVLTALLGIDPDLVSQGEPKVAERRAVMTLAGMLTVAVEHEVYDVTAGPDDTMLPWLQKLGAWLLHPSRRIAEMYDCLRHVITMDHTSLEPRLTEVFTSWVNSEISSAETHRAVARLLSHVVTLYGRLRRVPVMVERCLTALRARTLTTPLTVPKEVNHSFAAVVTALPPSTCVGLWQTLYEEIKTHYIGDGESVNGLRGVMSLLSVLLLNARLVDPSVPQQVAAQVQRLVVDTSDYLSQPLADRAIEKTDLVPFITLIHALGQLRLLLAQFTPLDLGKLGFLQQGLEDMTLLSPGLKENECECWYEEMKRRNLGTALYLFDECVILKLRAIILIYKKAGDEAKDGPVEGFDEDPEGERDYCGCGGKNDSEGNHTCTPQELEGRREEVVKELMKHLFKQLPAPDQVDNSTVWTREVSEVTVVNYPLAVFDLVCRHIALIIPFCSNDQVSRLARLIVSARLQPRANSSGDQVTMATVAGRFLSGAPCQELKALQSAIVSEILDQLAGLITKAGSSRSGSKHTSGSLLTALANVHRGLYETDTEMTSFEALSSVAKQVAPLKSGISWQHACIPNIMALLQVQAELPLEHLLPVNKAACLLQLLILAKTGQNWSLLGGTSFSQLMVILDNPDLSPFLRTLDMGDLLLYLISTVEEGIGEKTTSHRENMAFVLLKTATKDRTTAGQLSTYMTECHLVSKLAVDGNVVHGLEMSLLAKTLGTLRTVVERAHQDPSLRDVCLKYFTELADKTLCRLSSPIFHQEAVPPAPLEASSVAVGVVRCYGHVLDHVWYVRRQQAQTRHKEREEERMDVPGDEEHDKTEESMIEETSSKSSSPEESSEGDMDSSSPDSEEEGYVGELYKTLLHHLPTVCTVLRRVLTTSKDTAVITTCLPLVDTLCTNYEALKRHLPADVRTDTLSLVLDILQQTDEDTPGTSPTQTEGVRDGRLAGAGDHTPSGTGDHTPSGTSDHPPSGTGDHTPSGTGDHTPSGTGDHTPSGTVDHTPSGTGDHTPSGTGDHTPSGTGDLGVRLRQTVVAVMTSLHHDHFTTTLHRLVRPLTVESLRRKPRSVIMMLDTLGELLDARLDEDSSQTLKYASQNVLVPLQDILLACHSRRSHDVTLDVITAILNTQTKMASYGPSLLSPRCVLLCLHSLLYVPLGGSTPLSDFARVHQGAYELLNALLVHHEKAVFAAVPPYLNAAKLLLTSVILRSDQHLQDAVADVGDVLPTSALRVYRLFSLMATHKAHFTKVAAYIVADFITYVQQVTVTPKVKKTLTLAVYEVLDLCDEHAVRLLSTTLSTSGKEVFRGLQAEYQRYHLYKGRV